MVEQKISIIIPVRNGGDIFRECLDALSKIEYVNFEIIVVDDASTDSTVDIARSSGCKCITLNSNKGPSIARNIGARNAEGDILFFIDSDILLPPHALSLVNNSLSDPDVDGIVGLLSKDNELKSISGTYENLYMHYMYSCHDDNIPIFYTSASAIKRHAFEAVYGFDENYSRPGIEDMEFGRRLIANGFTLKLNKHLSVVHKKELTLSKMILLNYKKAVGTARLVARSVLHNEGGKPVSSNWGFLFSIPLTYMGVSFSVIAIFNSALTLFLIATIILLSTLLLNMHFLSFLKKERGITFLLNGIVILWLNFAVYGLGIAWGFISYSLGVKY